MNNKFKLVATGGTFDRFHKGHQALLSKAFEVSDKVIIGVTSDEMVKREKKVLKDHVLPYNKRVEDVLKFLKSKGYKGREIIALLSNIYGPTVLEKSVEAIVCTRETKNGADDINKARKSKGLPLASIIECAFVVSDDKKHISSTRIRLGEIDRDGKILSGVAQTKKLTKSLRDHLHKPVGKLYSTIPKLFKEFENPTMVIAVGDYLYSSLVKGGIKPSIVFVDNRVNNKEVKTVIKSDFKTNNPPSNVTKELFLTTKKAIDKYLATKRLVTVLIEGEEDLSVLPAIILSPLDSLIIYGQPKIDSQNSGIVAVWVTEDKKKWALDLLNKFSL